MSWIYLNRADLLRCVRGLPDLSRFFSFSHLSGNVESTYEIDDTGAGDVPQYLYQVISTNSKPKPVAGGLPDGLVLRGVTELAFYLSLSLVWSMGEGAIVAPMTLVTKAFVILSIVVNLTSNPCMHSFSHSYAICRMIARSWGQISQRDRHCLISSV